MYLPNRFIIYGSSLIARLMTISVIPGNFLNKSSLLTGYLDYLIYATILEHTEVYDLSFEM